MPDVEHGRKTRARQEEHLRRQHDAQKIRKTRALLRVKPGATSGARREAAAHATTESSPMDSVAQENTTPKKRQTSASSPRSAGKAAGMSVMEM